MCQCMNFWLSNPGPCLRLRSCVLNFFDLVPAESKRKKDCGFTAVGHINPFLDEGEDQIYFKPRVAKMRDAIDNIDGCGRAWATIWIFALNFTIA